MPNIRSQHFGPPGSENPGLHIVASDGREFHGTWAQLKARFDQETGTRRQKTVKALVWARGRIVLALGEDQIDVAALDIDLDDIDTPSQLLLAIRTAVEAAT